MRSITDGAQRVKVYHGEIKEVRYNFPDKVDFALEPIVYLSEGSKETRLYEQFDWGYSSRGARILARTLLLDAMPGLTEQALPWYIERFTADVVSNLERSWRLPQKAILAWYQGVRQQALDTASYSVGKAVGR